MAEKKIKAVLEIGGAVSGTLNRSFAMATGNTKKLGTALRGMNADAKKLRADMKAGLGGPEAARQLATLENRINSTRRAMESLNRINAAQLGSKLSRIGSTARRAALIYTGVATAVGAALYKITTDYGNFGDAAMESSTGLGLHVNELLALRYAASQSSVEQEKLEGSIAKFRTTLELARKGTGNASKALKILGLDAKAMSRMGTYEAFMQTADALANYNGKISKTALMNVLFSKSGYKLIDMFKGGRAQIEAFRKEAEAAGYTLSEDALADIEQFDHQMGRLNMTFTGARNTIGKELLPVLNSLMVRAADFVRANRGRIGELAREFADRLPSVIRQMRELGQTVFDTGKKVFDFLEPLIGVKGILIGIAAIPLLPVIGAIVSFGAALIGIIPAVFGLATAIGAVTIAGAPLWLILGAIVATVVGFGVAIKNVTDHWVYYEFAFRQAADWMAEKWTTLKTAAVDFGKAIYESVTSAFNSMKSVAAQWFDYVLAKFESVSGYLKAISFAVNPGAAIGNAIGKAAGGAIAGQRAAGGPVNAGSSYLVGEKGPELFTPRASGTIHPNRGGGGTDARTYNVTINASPGMDVRALADLVISRLDGRQVALASGALYDG